MTPLLALLAACASKAAPPEQDDEGSSSDASGATVDPLTDGGTASSMGESGDAEAASSSSSGATPADSGSSSGEPCTAGTRGCDCVEGECIGDLLCYEGFGCFGPYDCVGPDGTLNCPCVDGECMGELQCLGVTCVASCTDDPDNDDLHCGGECGNACTIAAGWGGCEEGECLPHGSECFETDGTTSCPDICAAEGSTCTSCTPDEDPGEVYKTWPSEALCEAGVGGSAVAVNGCGEPPSAGAWARCCCE